MSNKSILLIEPEVSLAEVLKICLGELTGWNVTVSASIRASINLCKSICPDVILLDASTSESDALLFIEQLKQHSAVRSIPILLITARADWFTTHQLSQMGFAGAIKPFTPSALPAQISHLLGWSTS